MKVRKTNIGSDSKGRVYMVTFDRGYYESTPAYLARTKKYQEEAIRLNKEASTRNYLKGGRDWAKESSRSTRGKR